MIDDKRTFEKFGYTLMELKSKSNKRVVAICDQCGNERDVIRQQYRGLCRSCSKTGVKNSFYGKRHTTESKRKISENHADVSGENNPRGMLGKHHSDETKQKMSIAKSGENNPLFGKDHSGENNPFFGKHHTDETKELIRNEPVFHHYIYDHSDLSKNTMKMSRARHSRLHANMRKDGIKIPHINTGV